MSFQSIVMTIAIVILIICLIVLAILMWSSRKELAYPPEIGTCPDYFVMKDNNGKDMCYNAKGLGKGGDDCLWGSFGDSKKDKREWAESCGVTWDGLTNR